MNKEMASGVTAADGLEHFDLHGMPERGFPNALMGGAGAVALDVVRLAGAIARGGTEATVGVDSAIADVNGVALTPCFTIGVQRFDELINTALALRGDVLLELETAETATAALA